MLVRRGLRVWGAGFWISPSSPPHPSPCPQQLRLSAAPLFGAISSLTPRVRQWRLRHPSLLPGAHRFLNIKPCPLLHPSLLQSSTEGQAVAVPPLGWDILYSCLAHTADDLRAVVDLRTALRSWDAPDQGRKVCVWVGGSVAGMFHLSF